MLGIIGQNFLMKLNWSQTRKEEIAMERAKMLRIDELIREFHEIPSKKQNIRIGALENEWYTGAPNVDGLIERPSDDTLFKICGEDRSDTTKKLSTIREMTDLAETKEDNTTNPKKGTTITMLANIAHTARFFVVFFFVAMSLFFYPYGIMLITLPYHFFWYAFPQKMIAISTVGWLGRLLGRVPMMTFEPMTRAANLSLWLTTALWTMLICTVLYQGAKWLYRDY